MGMDKEFKERPILFSAPMVRALLDGSKTQTRRLVKSPEKAISGCDISGLIDQPKVIADYSPYGKIGDRIWVRETFCKVDDSGYGDPAGIWVDYRATPKYKESHPAGWDNDPHNEDALKWKPSIHMPRWASRINLEITSVRVERLNDISEADAKAEGAPSYEEGIDAPPPDDGEYSWSYVASFRSLWESISGSGSWQANPWVWAITFKVSP